MRSIRDRAAMTEAIIAQLRASMRELRCMSGDRMRRADLSFTHFHIVSLLERHGEMPMSHLADMLDVSLSNTSGVIDRLEERGLVERIRVSDDRRIVLVRATDQGRRMLGEVEVLKDEMLQRVIARLDDTQLHRVARSLEDLQAAAAAALAEDPPFGRHEHLHEHGPVRDERHRDDPSHPAIPTPDSVPAPAPAS